MEATAAALELELEEELADEATIVGTEISKTETTPNIAKIDFVILIFSFYLRSKDMSVNRSDFI